MATIRHAVKADIPTILNLIQELADYEKESSAVEATHETLSQTIAFADSPESISRARPARALLITNEKGLDVGLALYFYNYSTWKAAPGIYLEDLFVQESERGKGYGQKLLGTLAQEVVDMKGGRLEWCVLKWNEPSIKFYESEKIGARAMGEWQTMRVDGEGLGRLAKLAG